MLAHCCVRVFTDWLCFSSFTLFHCSPEDSILGEGPVERPGARLCLSDGPLRTTVKRRYGKRLGLEKTAHVLIAGDSSPSQPGREDRASTWGSRPYTGHRVDNSAAASELGYAAAVSPSQCLFLQLTSGRGVIPMPQAPSEVALLRLSKIYLTTW